MLGGELMPGLILGGIGFVGPVILLLIGLIIPLASIGDALITPSSLFRRANSNKLLWVVLPFFFGFIASGIYFAYVRPRLKMVKHSNTIAGR
jgi:predicted MFS family arabinose efflux permease